MITKGYPNPTQNEYLIFSIEKESTNDLGNLNWDCNELEEYKKLEQLESNARTLAGIPFTVSLTDLMKVKSKIDH